MIIKSVLCFLLLFFVVNIMPIMVLSPPVSGRFVPLAAIQVRRYHLTDAAKPFAQERKKIMGDMATDLCWGKRVLDKVVKWDAPMSMGDYKMTNIAYTYKIANLAEWGEQPRGAGSLPAYQEDS